MTPTALLFPGQGSHAAGMDEPFRDDARLARGLAVLGYDPFPRLGEGTRYQQPALFLAAALEYERDHAQDGDVVAAAGHSLGEYAALLAAGALEFEDAVRLVDERAAAMAEAGERHPGGMVAMLGGDRDAIEALAERLGLTIANDNAPGQLVLAGALEALDAAEAEAKDATGARPRRLPVTGAFHSPLMAPAADRLRAALKATPVAEPSFPVYSNGTARPFEDVRGELAENLLRPVRFRETVHAMRAAGVEEFVECGPGEVLTGLVKRTLREVPAA